MDNKKDEWLTNTDNQIVRFNDRVEFRENGKLSRIGGYAVIYKSGDIKNKYYYNGKELTRSEFLLLNKKNKLDQI